MGKFTDKFNEANRIRRELTVDADPSLSKIQAGTKAFNAILAIDDAVAAAQNAEQLAKALYIRGILQHYIDTLALSETGKKLPSYGGAFSKVTLETFKLCLDVAAAASKDGLVRVTVASLARDMVHTDDEQLQIDGFGILLELARTKLDNPQDQWEISARSDAVKFLKYHLYEMKPYVPTVIAGGELFRMKDNDPDTAEIKGATGRWVALRNATDADLQSAAKKSVTTFKRYYVRGRTNCTKSAEDGYSSGSSDVSSDVDMLDVSASSSSSDSKLLLKGGSDATIREALLPSPSKKSQRLSWGGRTKQEKVKWGTTYSALTDIVTGEKLPSLESFDALKERAAFLVAGMTHAEVAQLRTDKALDGSCKGESYEAGGDGLGLITSDIDGGRTVKVGR